MHAVVSVDDLAEFIFIANKNNNKLEIDFSSLGNGKELFLFLIDLMCKGLVLLYGSGNRLELDMVSQEQFHIIASKFKPAGITVALTTTSNDQSMASNIELLPDFNTMSTEFPIDKMRLKITSAQAVYIIQFLLTHENI